MLGEGYSRQFLARCLHDMIGLISDELLCELFRSPDVYVLRSKAAEALAKRLITMEMPQALVRYIQQQASKPIPQVLRLNL
jgi:hypothetical protein